MDVVSFLRSSQAVAFFVIPGTFPFVHVFFVASSATFFAFAAIRIRSLVTHMHMPWSLNEAAGALDAPFNTADPAFMEPQVRPLVPILHPCSAVTFSLGIAYS